MQLYILLHDITMLQMERPNLNNAKTLLVLFIMINLFKKSQTLNVNNNKDINSYAIFPKWLLNKENNILEFKFKTYKSNGLLLVVNDEFKKENELKVSLASGLLHLYFKMGSEDMLSVKETDIGSEWNDMQWHSVKLNHRYREVFLQIDQYEYNLFTDGDSDWLIFTSEVFIGGNPDNNFEGFTGCITDLLYEGSTSSLTPVKLIGNVQKACSDKCSKDEAAVCQYNSRCRKYFDNTDLRCDCTGTGYNGNTCNKKEITGYFAESSILTRSMDALTNFRVNKIELRFRTTEPSGILLYSRYSGSFILLEMYLGRIYLSATFGADEIRLKSRLIYHDGGWHSVVVRRFDINVTLDIDRGKDYSNQWLLYQPHQTSSVEKQKVSVGGYHSPLDLSLSQSQSNFVGCLQQVYFQEENVEVISQVQLTSDIYTQRAGDKVLLWKCPIESTTIKQDIIPVTDSSSNRLINLSRKKLDHKTVAWVTAGICIVAIMLIVSIAFAFHFTRKRYSGRFTTKLRNGGGKSYGATKAPSIELSYDLTDKKDRPRKSGDSSAVDL